jgi:hypothetical protein
MTMIDYLMVQAIKCFLKVIQDHPAIFVTWISFSEVLMEKFYKGINTSLVSIIYSFGTSVIDRGRRLSLMDLNINVYLVAQLFHVAITQVICKSLQGGASR